MHTVFWLEGWRHRNYEDNIKMYSVWTVMKSDGFV
jgi:hypothetical protein